MKELLSILTALLFAVPALAALQPGAPAPRFDAPAARDGRELSFSLSEALAKGPVVVYFYPSAFTGGCDREAHAFSASMEKFTAAGATVVGVSLDSMERLVAFSADPDTCAGNVTVASDPDGAVAGRYEVPVGEVHPGAKDSRGEEIGHGFAQRTTFVVDRGGEIAATIAGVSPEEHAAQALAAVQGL